MTKDILDLLSSYPRSRPALSQELQRIYIAHYQDNREGNRWLTSLKNGLEAWMHRRIAGRQHGTEILEIGAGSLNHLRYEPQGLSYDAVEPFRELWEGRPGLSRLRRMCLSIDDIPESARYDRILSVAVLEHLTDLPRVLASAALRLRADGLFQAGFPSEGGVLWGVGWRLSTAIEFRLRTGLSYADVMRHEHVNTAGEILKLCNWIFEQVKTERFPVGLHHSSFYAVLEARGPRLDRCRQLVRGAIE